MAHWLLALKVILHKQKADQFVILDCQGWWMGLSDNWPTGNGTFIAIDAAPLNPDVVKVQLQNPHAMLPLSLQKKCN